MPFVKICGVRDLDIARLCVECGADAIGFVFHRKSPRYIHPSKAREIAEHIGDCLIFVAVFKSAGEIDHSVLDFCQLIQVYEPVEHLADRLVLGVCGPTTYSARYYLVDASHGKGRFFDYPQDLWGLPREKVILSGGLTPYNVAKVVKTYRPFGVDVSSGVESSVGVKDPKLISMFIQNVKGVSL